MAAADYEKNLSAIRSKIAGAKAEMERLDTDPMPKADFKRSISEAVAASQSAHATTMDLTLRGVADPDLATRGAAWQQLMTVVPPIHVSREHPTQIVPLSPLLTWLAGDDIVRWLHAKVDAMDYAAGPPMAERAKRRAELTQELHRLEVEEERTICRAEAAGFYFARRMDADPLIVLEYSEAGEMREPGLPRGRVPLHGPAADADAGSARSGATHVPTAEAATARTGMPAPRMGLAPAGASVVDRLFKR
jgi:hypothetical protein